MFKHVAREIPVLLKLSIHWSQAKLLAPLLEGFSITGFILIARISKELKGVSHLQNMEDFFTS